MSLLLNQPWKLCLRKTVLVRSSSLQSPPCYIIGTKPCGDDLGKLIIMNANESNRTHLEKKVPLELMKERATIGSSHGWVATLKDDGILRLQDDLNPVASDTDPKRILLPPLVTLPHCQTQMVTNVAMSSSSPEDEECVVAVKFLGPQLSFCKPAQRNPEWINIRIEDPCFFSSQVMFSKKEDMFRILASGGHLIRSWDLRTNPKLHEVQFRNLPNTKPELLDSCCTTEHLVESRATGETFVVKWHRKAADIINGTAQMKTEALMVFRLDEEGNAVCTRDIGELCIFISKSEPFCVSASSFPGLLPNTVEIFDVDEAGCVNLAGGKYIGGNPKRGFVAPYHIPPQNID
ncbi:uncharacterized protein LOC110227633 [Arabidopsis lyrata subsp. lyrata]|uniref:uncharacterized protein LOC110227633 n=1 Tax=Arabidopsis lyrata subsp. lyrata TaxID=81972 RepID=UPI000A29B434|nr:uncharacterized protein LOC110227633 [Arabidopsis lyrata subsp. lyrata]|eukprot:XP_020878159.1 uncharacterized protein LOC110227633 [Arabidopsis lyrata subsp. lyrata]